MNRQLDKLKTLLRTGFFHIFGGSVLSKIVGFLSSVVLVRILTKNEYGVFTYAWNIYSIVILANGCGVESGVLQVCSERSGEEPFARRICNYATRLGLAFDVLLMAVLVGIGLFVPMSIAGAEELLIMLAALPMLKILFAVVTVYLRAQKRNQDFAKLTVINTVLVFAVSAAGAIVLREKGLVLGYYVAYAASALLGVCWLRAPLLSREPLPEASDRKALRSVSFVSMCNNGLSQLLYLLDVFVLGIVAAEETVLASYRVATLIPSALTFIPVALVTYVYPYFAEKRSDGKWCLEQYKKVMLGLGGLNILISGTLFLLAPWLVRLLFGEVYLDAVPVFRILSLNYFISGTFRTVSGNLLVTQRKLKFNLLVALISGSVNVLADFLFISWWGPTGAALATVLVTLVSGVMSTVYLVHTFRKATGAESE